MEGSRHEKAALITVAYGIGMLTAFIWFGQQPAKLERETFTTIPQAAAVVSALPTEPVEVTQTDTETTVVRYEDGTLSVDAFGASKVLSFNPAVTGYDATDDFLVQGAHVGDLLYIVSPAQDYVFFCEQKVVDGETCSPFVYDVIADVIYPVRQNDQLVELLISAAAEVSWTVSGLSIGNSVSATVTTPWLLNS